MVAEQAMEELTTRVERILAILAEGRRSLAVPEASEWKALALARWEMLRAVAEYTDFKAQHVLGPMIQSACPDTARQAQALAIANFRMRDDYHAFVEHWALNSPIAADAPYRAAAMAMAGQIERQLVGDVQQIDLLLRAAAPPGEA